MHLMMLQVNVDTDDTFIPFITQILCVSLQPKHVLKKKMVRV